MGHVSVAACDKCHYSERYAVGGGLLNHRTVAEFPVSCRSCGALRTANFLKEPLRCTTCDSLDVLPFTAPGMCNNDSNHIIERWGDLKLSDSLYRCPKCDAVALRFGRGGPSVMFD